MSGKGDDSFLGRWSRRKQAARSEDKPAEEAAPDKEAPANAPVADSGEDGAAPEVDKAYLAQLPPIDEIVKGTDVRPFLKRGVPEALRNAALRRAWSADPAIRDFVDAALDYAWDFNKPGGVPGGGGTLDPERVAKMVARLARGPDPPQERSAEAELDERDTGDAEAPPGSDPPPEASQPAPAPDLADRPERPATAEEPRPQRRHGGATPK